MRLSIKKSTLKASIFAAPKKADTRYYLNGVCLSFKHGAVNRLEVSSTDGHMLSVFSDPLEYQDNPQTADFEMIVPLETIKAAAKSKYDTVSLESMSDGRYALGGVIFSPIDGKFPDYRRVIPSSVSGEACQCNPALLQRGFDAMQAYYDYSDKALFQNVVHDMNGEGSSVIHAGQNNAVVVVMPLRKADLTFQGLYTS